LLFLLLLLLFSVMNIDHIALKFLTARKLKKNINGYYVITSRNLNVCLLTAKINTFSIFFWKFAEITNKKCQKDTVTKIMLVNKKLLILLLIILPPLFLVKIPR